MSAEPPRPLTFQNFCWFSQPSGPADSRLFLIRNLLHSQDHLSSDEEDEEEFVPSKKELQSSSEEEDEGDEEEGPGSVKKSRLSSAGSRTPRSTQKTCSSSQTPRKTPRKVSVSTETAAGQQMELTSPGPSRLHRPQRERHGPPGTPRPASPAGLCQLDGPPTFWRRPGSGESPQTEPDRPAEF